MGDMMSCLRHAEPNQELWLENERSCNANPLTLSAGELMWVTIDLVGEQANALHVFADPVRDF